MPSPWDAGFVEIADRVFVRRYREWDVSIGVVVGERGALVVDTRASLAQGRALASDVRRLSGTPHVRWVVNTHEHFDHVFGNGAFDSEGSAGQVAIHAHEVAAASMVAAGERIKGLIRDDPELDPEQPEITAQVLQDVLDTEVALPTVTFSSASTIDLGDRYVELLHLGRGHTAGDLVVRIPDADVVFAGDLIEESADREATPGFGSDCFPLEWAETLDLLIGVLSDASVVVPGHGVVVDKPFVQTQRDDIADLAEMIRALVAHGVPVDEALAAGRQASRPLPLAGLADASTTAPTGWPFPDRYLEQAVRRGYEHLGPAARPGLPIVHGPVRD